MPSHDPALLYAIQMAPQGRGYALFNPQPLRRGNELVRDPCVDIGDVGYISDGSFHLLFNVHRQSHDPLQIHGVPRGFRPLERNGSLIEYHLRPCPRVMHSSEEFATELGAGVSVEGVDGPSITWTLERERGATLAYFDRHEVWNAQNKESYKQYFRSNYKSWVDFLRSLGIDRTLRDLILVTGCDRTRAWATMFSESRTVAGRVSLEVRTTVGPSISLTASVRWGTSHTFPSLSGPSADELSSSTRALLANTGDNAATVPHTGGVTADQCMFVRGWQGRSLFRIAELKAAAGPYDPGAYEDPDESEDDKMFVVLDSDEEDSQNRIVEDILQSSQNTSETVLSIALDAIANHRHHDDGILLMHDDELAAQLPGPGEMEWNSVEEARSYLEDHFRNVSLKGFHLADDFSEDGEMNVDDNDHDMSLSRLIYQPKHSTAEDVLEGSNNPIRPWYDYLRTSTQEKAYGPLSNSVAQVTEKQRVGKHDIPDMRLLIPFTTPFRPYGKRSTGRMENAVKEVDPQPIWFIRRDGALGVPVKFGVVEIPSLENGDEECLDLNGKPRTSLKIKFNWPGYSQWERQIRPRSETGDCSIGRVACLVASKVNLFLMDHDASRGVIGTDPRYVIGRQPGQISAEDVILLGIVMVATGAAMPILQLRHGFAFAC